MSRDFIIQRYCAENWPAILGQVPFIATGPMFEHWTVRGSLERHGQWLFRPELRWALLKLFPRDGIHRELFAQQAIAEFLLREGIVAALWVANARDPILHDERWDGSVRQVAREIPYPSPGTVADWTIELLSGMSPPAHFRSYLLEDEITLEPVAVPPDAV